MPKVTELVSAKMKWSFYTTIVLSYLSVVFVLFGYFPFINLHKIYSASGSSLNKTSFFICWHLINNKLYFHCWDILGFYSNTTCNIVSHSFPPAFLCLWFSICLECHWPHSLPGQLFSPWRPRSLVRPPVKPSPSAQKKLATCVPSPHPHIVFLMQVLNIFMHLHLPLNHELLKVWDCY